MTKKTKQIIKNLQNDLDYCVNKIKSMSERLDLTYNFINSVQNKIAIKVSSGYPMYSIHAYYSHCGEIYKVSKYISHSMFIALNMADNLEAEIISSNDKYAVFSVLGKDNKKFHFIIDKYNNTLMEYPDISNIENNKE